MTREQLKTAIEEALGQLFTATTKSTVPDIPVINKGEWREFKRKVRNIGWRIHPSVDVLSKKTVFCPSKSMTSRSLWRDA